VQSKLHIFSPLYLSFFHLVEENHFMNFESSNRQLAGFITDGCLCCCGVEVSDSLSHILCAGSVISEHSQVWSPWKHNAHPFNFGLCCSFWKMWTWLGWPSLAKTIAFLVHFTVFLQDG
jgi:hypothetical protein